MEYQVVLGDILFLIDTPLPFLKRREDSHFIYCDEKWRMKINVKIYLAAERPNWIVREVFQNDQVRIGYDQRNREIREYSATFLPGNPKYAVSVLEDSVITVFLNNDQCIWENPNVTFWSFLHLETVLLQMQAMVLHCSYLMHAGEAILFSAPSGTGKTTQAQLWEKLYPARVINGDKAIIILKDGVWYACGYPFHGSAEECYNESYPIKSIVVVRRGAKNTVQEMPMMEKIRAIYSELTVPMWKPEAVGKTFDLLMNLAMNVPVMHQYCTMQDEACYTLYDTLYLK